MAARRLLLILLGAAVVAPEHPLQVAQETLELELELEQQHVEQLLQQEQDPPLPPHILVAAGATRPPLSLPGWGSALDGFPPAWPEAPAVTQHCHRLPAAPPAPPLPPSSFAHLRRQAAALAALHPRISACCQLRQPLPCARRAWLDVLDDFCADEFGVKTRQFQAGRGRPAPLLRAGPRRRGRRGRRRPPDRRRHRLGRPRAALPPRGAHGRQLGEHLRVFGAAAQPPRPLRPPRAHEPAPGARVRPLLPQPEPGLRPPRLAEGAGAVLPGGGCGEDGAAPVLPAPGGGPGAAASPPPPPHPNYDRELYNVSLARPGPALLRSLCAPTRLVTKRRPVPELLGAVTSACCPVSPEQQSTCAQDQLSQAIAALCASPWRDPRGCCSRGGPARRRCFDSSYLAQVTLGAAVPPPPPGLDP
ncbi:hypothetical protein Q9966_004731 [Columba livia]|nr:hypothetical protein Q9966_004731 [Columba livia]